MKKASFCPICKLEVKQQESAFPFCSERCRTIDLGHWADGSYHIAREPVPDPETNEDMDTGHSIH